MSNEMRTSRKRRNKKVFNKINLAVICLALVLLCGVGGTFAYIITGTGPLTNIFKESEVTCKVIETFNDETGEKTNVTVQNTGDTEAFIRVKLISYRENEKGQRIGGKATVPNIVTPNDWVKIDDCYYYTKPVAPKTMISSKLIGTPGITLEDDYGITVDEPDGGRQVIEVMAEAIQSKPRAAIVDAWGEDVADVLYGSANADSSDNTTIIIE